MSERPRPETRRPSDAAVGQGPGPDPVTIAPRLRILILEDRSADAELVVHELRRAGFQVEWRMVDREEDYLAALDDEPDVILADYTLPQFDARRALRLLQERQLDIPMIVVTGTINEEVAVECMREGAADYLLKDRLSRIAPAVSRALEQRRLRREKREAEDALRQSESRYRAISELTSDFAYAFTLTPPGTLAFEWVTDALAPATGYTPAEISQLGGWPALVHPDDRRVVQDQLATVLGGQPASREFRIITRSGEVRVLRNHARPVFGPDGEQVTRVYGAAQDVTERHRSEQQQVQLAREQAARAEAEASQQRFAFLAEASRLLVSSLDWERTLDQVAHLAVPYLADWCFVIVSDFSSGPANGSVSHFREIASVHADGRAEAVARRFIATHEKDEDNPLGLVQVLRSGEALLVPTVTEETLSRIARNDGEARLLRELGLCSYVIAPMIAHGRTLGAIVLNSLQPERRYAEADFNLAIDLARRAALAVDNARLYQEAQGALQARNAFFSSISHDLKTPLTVIKGQAQLLRRRLGRIDGVDVTWLREGLDNVEATAERMTGLINQILDLARLQANQPLDLNLRPTDLVALAREAVGQHQATTDVHRLHVSADPEEVIGLWDADRLRRVLDNLLSNAIKYSPRGGAVDVSVTIENGPGHPLATVRVRDEGLGIAVADLPRLFAPFQRARNTAVRIHGTGVGLASARQIVEQHGGTIGVESKEGTGSTFTVRLPLATRST